MKWIPACLTVLLLAFSCATGKGPVTPSSLKANQIAVVGKLIITPSISYNDVNDNNGQFPLDPSEDKLKLKNDLDHLFLVTKESAFQVSDLSRNPILTYTLIDPSGSNSQNAANEDKLFIADGLMTDTLYLNGFYTRYYNRTAAVFPYPCTIKVPQGARAVYIGTIIFERNRYYQVTKVTRKDEYDEAVKEFQKTFPGWELVRADVVPYKEPK